MGGCFMRGNNDATIQTVGKKNLAHAALFEVDGFRYRSTHPTRY